MPLVANATGAPSCPPGGAGASCAYNGTNRFRIVLKADPLMGQPVSKVGRTTGLTRGTVTKTCETEVRTDGTFLCQVEADYAARGGDSGSPVFTPVGSTAVLVGIHWLGVEGPGVHVFSPISGVQRDLGTLGVCTALFDDVFLC